MPRFVYVRMLASRSIENVMTRVMSAWNASAIRSNISLKCSVMSFGVPTGASGMSSRDVSCCDGHLHAPLDLADRVQVIAHDDAVAERRGWPAAARPVP